MTRSHVGACTTFTTPASFLHFVDRALCVITNNSVEATARMSGNLGFLTVVVSDATATFGRDDFDGRWRTAGEVHAM